MVRLERFASAVQALKQKDMELERLRVKFQARLNGKDAAEC